MTRERIRSTVGALLVLTGFLALVMAAHGAPALGATTTHPASTIALESR